RLDRLANRERIGGGRQRFAEVHVPLVRKPLRPFPEELPALIAEDASPDVIGVNRDDGNRTALNDLLETALERQQEAGPRDAAFCEDADDLAAGQRLAGRA